MRLPVTTQISTKDGTTNKNARLTNCLKESKKGGDKAVIRPGLVLDAQASGIGYGLVVFNNELVSVYGATLGIGVEEAAEVGPMEEIVITGTNGSGYRFSESGTYLMGYHTVGLNTNIFSYNVATEVIEYYSVTFYADLATITDSGVIHRAYSPDDQNIYKWDSTSGVATNLGTLIGLSVLGEIEIAGVLAISEDGATIGGYYIDWEGDETYSQHVFKWTSGTGFTDEGLWSGGISTLGTINDSGDVVLAYMSTVGANRHLSTWVGAVETDHGDIGTSATLTAITKNGDYVAGYTTAPSRDAYIWNAVDGIVSVASYGGEFGDILYVLHITNDGSAFCGGVSLTTESEIRACKWSSTGGIEALTPLGTGDRSYAEAISNDGTLVAGRSTKLPVSNDYYPFISASVAGGTIPALTTITNGFYDFAQSPI
jgi:uncharacterized membrane protein